MNLDKKTNILIVGLGVIGGSYAAGLSRKGYHVSAISKEKESIEYAMEHNMICYGSTEVEENLIQKAELIIFALYPTIFVEWIKQYQHLLSPGCLITDVSGVKTQVIREVQKVLREDVEFVSSHPMAGREQSGIEFSNPDVFLGANYIVIQSEHHSKEAVNIIKQLGEILGFGRINELTAEEHDEMIAFLSQLTHCIAVSLMTCNNTPDLEKYTGDSFRDLTRISKINDKMWSELFIMNKAALLKSMDGFMEEFHGFRDMIEKEDFAGLREKMQMSTQRRCLFDKPQPQK